LFIYLSVYKTRAVQTPVILAPGPAPAVKTPGPALLVLSYIYENIIFVK
jgi:hypothetical protein